MVKLLMKVIIKNTRHDDTKSVCLYGKNKENIDMRMLSMKVIDGVVKGNPSDEIRDVFIQ